ncbi:hypothetical protein CONCODRAFT_10510 [Conidiobolus coronatus NRRL 28638]|uniref:F-box domain-containing protein n=1 Tax=Conidiobolus coronatus (strain ATCC 28846 / CBS 209.66 / NRRL 28638) TaxID=796925 RepID=A0A137NXT8_CONC2|nr:hypothetical protein CONCODRAFT_10510 [Conidiobolus coronatus NRRL 28638]|eukprot:KXN67429.1 hypothetical protein CONCODRAFT_10510 [Conidiobolus coronatus NRRL 28638]
MTRVLRSATKKLQSKVDLSSKLSISKKSKTIQRKAKKGIEAKNEDNRQNGIWNINPILSNIFAYTDHKDLVEFNTVCKKWNHLTNPIIHKNIRLNRRWNIINQVHDKRFNRRTKIDADVIECIYNNAKHARLVKEFTYNEKLEPQRAIEFFDTFRFISNLTIRRYKMSQDHFLGMISPLTQLQELNLSNLSISKIIYKRFYKEVVQLPPSLKKLKLHNIRLNENPELFIKTINSHSNLMEFSSTLCFNNGFLEPFYKPYPSLVNFEYHNYNQHSNQLLIKILENNHQLNSLKLLLNCWNNELSSYISSYLNNLEELDIIDYSSYYQDNTDLNLKFSQPTKIKKLSLVWGRLSNCSLDSILLNCPDLEELTLNRDTNYIQPNSDILINLSKSAKVKKLKINCESLNVAVLSTLLLICPRLNELVVNLPTQWREVVKEIYEKSLNLQRLEISPSRRIYSQQNGTFFREFYDSEFFNSSYKIKSTLTHLTLNEFNASDSKAEQFKNFEQLKSIKYTAQRYGNYRVFGKNRKINMKLWPGYKLLSNDSKYQYELEFKKIPS